MVSQPAKLHSKSIIKFKSIHLKNFKIHDCLMFVKKFQASKSTST